MKIPTSVRNLYADLRQKYERLQREVDRSLRALCHARRWHYESRIKEELSVALKLESGRIRKPDEIEDFFACTVVVRNLGEISEAEKEFCQRFDLKERRPRDEAFTHKEADAFPFDDLRLFVLWKDDPSLPPTGLDGVRFEIQIKTFLQHAWGIATHDLVYKTDDVSWSKARIAYQVKAMLEHAEVSIQEADRLAETGLLAKKQTSIEAIKDIITLVKQTWEPELLPDDLRRLAENTRAVMGIAGLKIAALRECLDAERARQNGALPINLSPYAIIVQAIAWHEPDSLRQGLSAEGLRSRLFLTQEMELPPWLSDPALPNIVRIREATSSREPV